jgi:hypothetical protein
VISRQTRSAPVAVLSITSVERRWATSPRTMPPSVVLTRSLMDGAVFSMQHSQMRLPASAKRLDSQYP